MSGLHNRQIEFYEPEEEAVITKDRKPTLIDRILKKKETALANGFTNLVIITASDYACTRPDEPPNTSHVAGRQDVAELENLIKDNLFKEHNIPLFSIFYLANHHYSKVLKISYSYFYTIYKEREKWQLIENLPLMTASKYTHQLKRQRQKVKKMESVLRGMVNFIPKEQKRVKRQIQAALEQLVLPLLEKLKSSHLPDESSTRLLENTIAQFTTVYGGKSAGKLLQLTQKELEICNMIRQGLTTKEIAGFLNLSSRTVENHRNNVCKKLGLAGQKMNLVTFLKNKVLQD
jgi:DNA-binding CsgD family transcriptional regulator